jgi:hypothetical protein
LCPSCEDEEDRLKGIIGIRSISKDALTGSVHQRSVSSHEVRESFLVALCQKSREQIRIVVADVRIRPAIEDLHQCCIRHRLARPRCIHLLSIMSNCLQSANRSSKKCFCDKYQIWLFLR